eukprot:2887539-Amphidinium_carterae.1
MESPNLQSSWKTSLPTRVTRQCGSQRTPPERSEGEARCADQEAHCGRHRAVDKQQYLLRPQPRCKGYEKI